MKRFHDSQSGSALTEFVIGLPIFIVIFWGVINLYDLNHKALETMGRAERHMWEQSLQIQTERFADPTRLVPIANVATDIYGGAAEPGSVTDAIDVASSMSLWADSGVKSELPTSLIDSDVEPHMALADVMGSGELYSHSLLNDATNLDGFSQGSGWAGVLGGLLDAAGSRPAIAAGYRYGAVRGEAAGEYENRFGEFELSSRVTTSAPTFPTHRIYAIALTRAELAQDVRYDEAIVEFNMEVRLDADELPPTSDESNDDETEVTNPLQDVFDEACAETEGVQGCQ